MIRRWIMMGLLCTSLSACSAASAPVSSGSSAQTANAAGKSTSSSSATQSAEPSEASTAAPAPAASSTSSAPPEASSFSAVFLDVGQGDAALLQCDGKYMLIDGGVPEESQKIYTVLKNKGITHLDYIVCTHAHSDHAGGLAGALQIASCDLALANVTSSDNAAFTKFVSQLEKHSVPLTVPSAGQVFSFGSAVFKVLGPTDMEPSMDENDKSLVLRFDYGNTSFLFAGDAEQEEQQLLMYNDYEDLKVNVLKAAHHGSSNGASYAWIKAVQPQITVISCGRNNDYGHPHAETLDLLKQYGSTLFRTDLQGDIVVTSDGTTVSAQVSKNPDADVWQPGAQVSSSASAASSEASSAAETSVTASQTEVQTAETASIQAYVVNTNTKKFHNPDCKSVRKIKDKNRMDFTGDRQKLIAQGYEPCKICHP